jgi:hypothetical protein
MPHDLSVIFFCLQDCSSHCCKFIPKYYLAKNVTVLDIVILIRSGEVSSSLAIRASCRSDVRMVIMEIGCFCYGSFFFV